MIPERFITEYPRRCLSLLDAVEPNAHAMDLTGTFSIMLAASMLTIPWERLKGRHPIHHDDDDLERGLRRLSRQPWGEAEFWRDADSGDWRFSRIMGDPNYVEGWADEMERPAMSDEANTIDRRSVDDVLRVLRNALAHGNIVYLNAEGCEVAGTRLEYLGFLSRYEETPEMREAAETYRLVAVKEGDFLSFIRTWTNWITDFRPDESLRRVG